MKTTKWFALVAGLAVTVSSGYAQTPEATASGQAQATVPSTLSPGAAEVVRMATSGVGDDVVLAYIQNSQAPFNLSANDVLYLKDVGLSPQVTSAMITHDGTLRGQAQQYAPAPTAAPPTAQPYAPVAPPPTAYQPAPAPAPTVAVAPAPVYVSSSPPADVAISITTSRPTAPGCNWTASAGAGSRRRWSFPTGGGLTAMAATGSIPTSDGTGSPRIRGAGRRSIMAGGICTRAAAGFGCPTGPGAPPG